MSSHKVLVFISTYNEAKNIENLFNKIEKLNLPIDVLFVDDNSPDGTGGIIDKLSSRHENVFAIHRNTKKGIGSAHITGIKWAYRHRYNRLVTMDCDFTHSPSKIPDFIRNSYDCDLVVGSRYIEKESLADWHIGRKIITTVAHYMTKFFLKIPYDATGAFRLYRLDKIPENIFNAIRSKGYSFFYESLYVLSVNGVSIKEIPIQLPSRNAGHSKMTFKDIWHGFFYLICLSIRTLINKKSFIPAHKEKANEKN